MITDPPSDDGALHVTVACPFHAVADTLVGAPETVGNVTALEVGVGVGVGTWVGGGVGIGVGIGVAVGKRVGVEIAGGGVGVEVGEDVAVGRTAVVALMLAATVASMLSVGNGV